jgi:hypothetical protein
MVKKATSLLDDKTLATGKDSKVGRIWCDVCGSDDYILIERARWRRLVDEGSWDIDYSCTNCDSFYGHVVRESDVTQSLMAAMAIATNES